MNANPQFLAATAHVDEAAIQPLPNSRKVYVEGSLRSRKWKDKEGNERTTVEVQSTRVLFLSGRSDAGPAPFDGPEPDYAAPDTYGASPEDDIPF